MHSPKSATYRIRLPIALDEAFRARVKASGTTAAELHRGALSRMLGFRDGKRIDYETSSNRDLLRQAALGDLCASRVLVQRTIASAMELEAAGLTARACESLMAASVYGQFAVALGGLEDERELARVYLIRARLARDAGENQDADELQTFALATLDELADAGDALATYYIEHAPGTTPEVYRAAHDLREGSK